MNSKFRVAITLALAVLVAGPMRIVHGAPSLQACSLLTPSQVGAILGFAVDAGKGSGSDCLWSEAGAGGYGRGVVLQMLGQTHSRTAEEEFNALKAPDPHGVTTKTPVTGLGDDAVYVIVGGKTALLAVKKGASVARIRVFGFPLEQAKDTEKALAQAIIAKL